MGYTVKQSARRAKESSTSPLVVPVAPYLTDDHVAVFLAMYHDHLRLCNLWARGIGFPVSAVVRVTRGGRE